VRAADMILVLQNGRLVDTGTHEELLDSSEIYRQIHASQLAEPEEVVQLRDRVFDAGEFEKELIS